MTGGRVCLFFVILTICAIEGASYVRMCYFTSWSLSRTDSRARLSLDDIDANLCTHLIFAFADIDVNTWTLVPNTDLYKKFNQIKARNSNLKTLLSVGGENSNVKLEQISASKNYVDQFASNVAKDLKYYGFDGLDVDWEFPTSTTKYRFTALIKGLHEEFEKESLVLTAAVSAGEPVIKNGYDIPEVSRYLDYILIMTYDFSGTWSRLAGFNSPLHRRNDPRFSPVYNVDHAVNVWLDGGADRSKVVVGTTGAGASFTLSNSNNNGVGAPVLSGGGPPGNIFKLKGRLIYPEICENLSNGWTRKWDEEQQVPYAYRGDNWVGYEDTQSITSKAEYVKKNGLGGVMFWELSFDDPHNVCNHGKYPLLRAASDVLDEPVIQTSGANMRACYFTSWSLGRTDSRANISLDDIDANLCTHLMFAFADIDVNARNFVSNADLFTRFNQIKARNPNLKTLLSVGGANENTRTKLEQISASKTTIDAFAKNVTTDLKKYGFDGLDVDWEFPTSSTKDQFTALLKGLREAFNKDDGQPLMVTAAVSAGEHIITTGYNISEVSRYLDYILIMSYDFFGPWSGVTGFNSPLFARRDPKFSPTNNVDHAVNVWLDGGADRSKIVVGTTGAGASFNLSDSSNNGVGAPVLSGGGPPGNIFKFKGRLIYPEICENLSNGWTREWDDEQQVPYAYRGDNWVGYEDTQSITSKAEYVKRKRLGGLMFWEVSFDDPHNLCKQGKYPLLTAVRDVLDPVEKDITSSNTDVMTTPQVSDVITKGDTTAVDTSPAASICFPYLLLFVNLVFCSRLL